MQSIWVKARVPTVADTSCVRIVLGVIELSKSFHKPGQLQNDEFKHKLDNLLDLKPKLRGKVSEEAQLQNLKSIMMQNSDRKRKCDQNDKSTWEAEVCLL